MLRIANKLNETNKAMKVKNPLGVTLYWADLRPVNFNPSPNWKETLPPWKGPQQKLGRDQAKKKRIK